MAKQFEAFFDWSEDIATRESALESFADFSGTEIQGNQFVWGDGLYLILHFDLITVNPHGPIDRSDAYTAINDVVLGNHGTRLSGSVYIVPLLPKTSSERCAALFWNALCDALDENLVHGDVFYLHYAPDIRSLMGGISVLVGVDRTLTKVAVPEL